MTMTIRAILILSAAAACTGGGSSGGRELIEDMAFSALVDDDGDGLSYNDPVRMLRLSDYFAANRPGTRVIMLNAAAGWCEPCMREASALPAFAAQFDPQGVAILSAVFQDQNGAPSDEAFARLWAEKARLSVPALIDTGFATGAYFDAGTMPANLFVDAETQEILLIATGADTGGDPLRRYRGFLDSHLAP